jgi:hypothetical protein
MKHPPDYDEVIHGNRRFVITEKVSAKSLFKRQKAYKFKLLKIIFSVIETISKDKGYSA